MTSTRHSRSHRGRLAAVLLAFAAAVVAAPGAASKAAPSFTTIDIPGATMTHAYAINARGDIAGSYVAAGKTVGFVLSKDGSLTTIDYPGATFTEAWGINARGDVIGRYIAGGGIHGFLLRNGVLSNIDVPGEANTMPTGISNDGTIVGCFHTTPWALQPPAYMHGYLRGNGGLTSVATVQTMNNGVAAGGTLVAGLGYDIATGLEYAYLIQNGTFTTLAVPGAVQASAWDVNDRGDVVGRFSDGTSQHAWLLSNGEYTTFDVPGATSTNAYGINDRGDVVGVYVDATGMHGFLMRR